jgi:hypothetical protein
MSPQPCRGRDDEPFDREGGRGLNLEASDSFRRILSGFNHRCRNLLNGIRLGLCVFKRQVAAPTPKFWEELEQSYREMERLFDWLQVIFRPLSLHLVRSPLGRLFAERLPLWRSWCDSNGVALELVPPRHDAAGDFDPMHLGMALDALVAWRAERIDPTGPVRLSWDLTDGFLELTWSEGPSTSSDKKRSGDDRPVSRACGVASLVLSLLNQIISAHDGTLQSTEDPAFHLRLRWPRYQLGEPPLSQRKTDA